MLNHGTAASYGVLHRRPDHCHHRFGRLPRQRFIAPWPKSAEESMLALTIGAAPTYLPPARPLPRPTGRPPTFPARQPPTVEPLVQTLGPGMFLFERFTWSTLTWVVLFCSGASVGGNPTEDPAPPDRAQVSVPLVGAGSDTFWCVSCADESRLMRFSTQGHGHVFRLQPLGMTHCPCREDRQNPTAKTT